MTPRSFEQFYYCDSYYQLELNLQTIRRALIYLLEESDTTECFVCNHLRCRCEDTFSMRSSTLSDPGFSFSEISSGSSLASELDFILISAPPADSLPMPVWQIARSHRSSPDSDNYCKDVEKWVRASTPHVDGKNAKFDINADIISEVNSSWPPAQASIWCEVLPRLRESPVGVVEAFFRYFADVSAQKGYSYF